ncbi:hypothetical protein LJL02_002103 [Escherichia coli]|nr:hypothetical protein [Escherichia albertii]EIJ6705663.1 hypothetical protein [Escherichia coli]
MINLSLTDLNRIQFREKFTGQLLVNVDKGRVVCNYHLPDEAIVATRESLQELAERAGMINANIQGGGETCAITSVRTQLPKLSER